MNVWLTLHVAGVALFLGNIVTAAFWKARADFGKRPEAVHAAVRNVMLADYVFTLPGIVLIAVSGIVMAQGAGIPMFGGNWLTASLLVFGATGAVWIGALLPLQRAMIRHSAASVVAGELSEAYRRASRRWAICGVACTFLPLVVLYFMIAKPF